MKKLFFGIAGLAFIVFSCSTDIEKVALEPGTPSYAFAKDLAVVLPSLDPDSNKVIIETKIFAITTGEVIELLFTNFGPRAGDLKKMPADRIKNIIESNGDQLAQKKLLLNAATESGLSVPETYVDSVLQAQYLQAGGESVFMDYLSKNGVTIEYVKSDVANGYLIGKYLDNVLLEESNISEKDLEDNYRQMIQKDITATVQHILLMTQGKSEKEKGEIYNKMKTILNKAKAGEDFGALAKSYSEDPGSKDKGGLYENFKRGTMVKPFEDAAFTVPIGELSDIIETRYGYHILKVISRAKETRSYEEVKPEITKELMKDKTGDLQKVHMEKLKEDNSYVKYSL